MNLSLLKELCDAMTVKNPRERSDLLTILRPKEELLKSPSIERGAVENSRMNFSPTKALSKTAIRDTDSRMEAKSAKSVSDIGEKR